MNQIETFIVELEAIRESIIKSRMKLEKLGLEHSGAIFYLLEDSEHFLNEATFQVKWRLAKSEA